MKKKSLLILPIALLSLVACSTTETSEEDKPTAPEETYTEDSSYSTYGVIDYVSQRGAAISSWTGVYGYWDTLLNTYIDGSYYYGDDEFYLDEEYCYSYTDEFYAATNSGVLTAIETIDYSDYSETTKGIEYYDGSTVYLNEDGVISSYNESRTLSSYTSDLGDIISQTLEYALEDYLYPTYSDSYYEINASVSASLGTAKSGNTQATITDIYYEVGLDYDWFVGYYYYEWLDETTITLVYDSNNQLVSMDYSYTNTYIYYGYVERYTQNITYLPYSGTIEVPSWVN